MQEIIKMLVYSGWFVTSSFLLVTTAGAQSIVIDNPWTPIYIPGTAWKAELETSGDWFDENLWTNGVPNEDLPAYLVNASETLLTDHSATARSLVFSSPSFGRSRLTHRGGQLALQGNLSILDGIYQLSGDGRLSAQAVDIGRIGQLALLPDLTDVPRPESTCSGETDRLCLPPTTLLATERRFQIDGGEAEINGEIEIGQGHLEILSGKLLAGSMHVDAQGWNNSDHEVLQSGGLVQLGGELQIQDGTYELSAGSLQVPKLSMGDPANNSWNFSLNPAARTPEFLQTGGTVHIAQNLELCVPGFIWPVPQGPVFTDVTYRLKQGDLTVLGDTVVGSLGATPAQFLQLGGTHRTEKTLRIEGAESRYELNAGRLQVGTLAVGTNVFNAGGTFAMNATAEFVVDSAMQLGILAEVEASPGAQVRIDGGEVAIEGTDSQLLSDLRHVSLWFTGDAQPSSLEATSLDLGNVSAGYHQNFDWDDLIVGNSAAAGHLQLVDEFENLAGTDAVYVDRLIVEAGSSLDLNGLNLYYRTADIRGQVLTAGGSLQAVPVPEPTGLVLTTLFGVLVVERRK